MKFTTTRRALASALSIVNGAVSSKNTIAGYNYVLLETSENKLTLSTTDGDTSIVTDCEAVVSTQGSISLPFESLKTAVNGFDGEVVDFELKGGTVGLKCAKSERNIQGADADDFPVIPEVGRLSGLSLGQGTLKSMISRTLKGCRTEGRDAYTGLCFEVDDRRIAVTGADGACLCHTEHPLDLMCDFGINTVLPVKPLTALCDHLAPGTDCAIQFGESMVEFLFGSTSFKTRVLDATYPPYRKFIPTHPHKVHVEREVFLRAAKSVHNVSQHLDGMNCLITIIPGCMAMFSQAPGEGDVSEELETEGGNQPMTISVNSSTLLRVVESAVGNMLEIGYDGPAKVLTFAEKGNEGAWIGVVGPNAMPEWGNK